ncbi:hypothetical protein [Mesorhizobium sp. M0199]|uniref:hypothetical protein n=1 Tax=unclassified Mesorhizobium TaxID=325217 RepID=UPI003336B728
MQQFGRDAPLPDQMQGKWVDADDPTVELIISGGCITCFGEGVAYDYKEIHQVDGALTVSLKVNDPAVEDSFERANITGLIIMPDGDFHVYNVRFASRFIRPET